MRTASKIVCSRLIIVLFSLLLCFPAFAAQGPNMVVLSPRAGSSSGSPVFFEATSSPYSCATGIAAMRIYSAPGVIAYTTQGPHLETFIPLAAGSHNVTVVAYDNCGGATAFPIAIMVSATAGVSVFVPRSDAEYGPTHFAASAQNPSCPAGIAAMRIYTAWGVFPYTVSGNQLDAFVRLGQGTYAATMQAWDNCGNVFKTNFTVNTTGGDSDGFVYTVSSFGNISKLYVLPDNSLSVNTPPARFSSGAQATGIVSHPEGRNVYVSFVNGIYGMRVNHSDGTLTPIGGSPFGQGTSPGTIFMDPAGNFVYTAEAGAATASGGKASILRSYKIDLSSGALTLSASTTIAAKVTAISTDPHGQFLYAVGVGGSAGTTAQIYGFRVDPNEGALSTVPDSPYAIDGASSPYALSAAYQYLYVGTETNGGDVRSYQINYNSGTLYPALGPYAAAGTSFNQQSLLADEPARYVWTGNQSMGGGENSFWFFNLDGYTGGLGAPHYISAGTTGASYLVEGSNHNVVYTTAGGACTAIGCPPATVSAWKVGGDGSLSLLGTPLANGSSDPKGITVVRADPE